MVQGSSAGRGAEAPGADHQAVLLGDVRGDAGGVPAGHGQQPQPVLGHGRGQRHGSRSRHEAISGGGGNLGRCEGVLPKTDESAGRKAAGRRYRLPSEAQWEYACRAGSTGRYSFSSGRRGIPKEVEEHELPVYGWFNSNSGSMADAVGGKRPSAWGLYDMHGNVWEWCQDWHDEDYYAKSPTDDPTGPFGGSDRVNRGGSWYYPARHCRAALRGHDGPGAHADSLGFRVSRVLADTAAGAEKLPGTVAPASDGLIATHGLGGLDKIAPTTFPQSWRTDRDFAKISWAGEMAFPKIPACRYVLETELTIGNPQNGRIVYRIVDAAQGADLSLGVVWPRDRTATTVPCRLFNVSPIGTLVWVGEEHFAIGQRLAFKLIAVDEERILFCNGKRVLGIRATPVDFTLKITADGTPDFTIHRCSVRPLNESDIEAVGREVPPYDLKLDPEKTARRIREQTSGLPALAETGKPFVVKSIDAAMRWIPAGEFTMGADADGKGKHRVRLSQGFWIGQYTVTQAQWLRLFETNPSRFRGSPYLPVHWVSWQDAMRFCEELDSRDAKQADCRPAASIVCLRRPNGNTPARRGPTNIRPRSRRNAGGAATAGTAFTRLANCLPTALACTTCAATWRSGAWTFGKSIQQNRPKLWRTLTRLRRIQPGLALPARRRLVAWEAGRVPADLARYERVGGGRLSRFSHRTSEDDYWDGQGSRNGQSSRNRCRAGEATAAC